ncbi:sulfite exporter TauE/SafE family protein [Marinilongibacter aquaticus]|uniref:sulfite exporter TauE/SafE family protein n=1 Tax=Marinilongibacter aquaticus TaxID=2975157 RepID=UPI0021BD3894|nr:sulfite exporter TauE/SafE family protein [Marinilongibacter aquaticus]UBM60504.1 sulfite exporter TauE/SafE family protein [Marinilongibacter aquaticus]
MSDSSKRVFKIFGLPVIAVYIIWFSYMFISENWHVFTEYFYMTITMMFGSFVAGASSEGGGAVAFPVMTLLFDIHPKEARDFSLAIQSIGMTAASLWIIARKVKVNKEYLKFGLVGGTLGIILGTYFVAPYTAPAYAKMLFVSFWLSFGITLYIVNRNTKRFVREELPDLSTYQQFELLFIALVGGVLSAILGNGVDICTFAFITMKYNLSEKIATPTSVMLMAANAVVGFLLHQFVLQDIQPVVYNYWMVSIPVVMLGAPFGAYMISNAQRMHIVNFLCGIIVIQFIGAMLIIRPTGPLLYFSLASFLLGVVLFFLLTRSARAEQAVLEE